MSWIKQTYLSAVTTRSIEALVWLVLKIVLNSARHKEEKASQ